MQAVSIVLLLLYLFDPYKVSPCLHNSIQPHFKNPQLLFIFLSKPTKHSYHVYLFSQSLDVQI